MGIQIVLLSFFNRLQDLVDQFYQERLQYYEQIIERQTIRQQAMEHAVTQIHNRPLQTLALLLRDIQRSPLPDPDLLQRLDALTDSTHLGHPSDPDPTATNPNPTVLEHILRLGEGTIDLVSGSVAPEWIIFCFYSILVAIRPRL
jgi:hypothetical protein